MSTPWPGWQQHFIRKGIHGSGARQPTSGGGSPEKLHGASSARQPTSWGGSPDQLRGPAGSPRRLCVCYGAALADTDSATASSRWWGPSGASSSSVPRETRSRGAISALGNNKGGGKDVEGTVLEPCLSQASTSAPASPVPALSTPTTPNPRSKDLLPWAPLSARTHYTRPGVGGRVVVERPTAPSSARGKIRRPLSQACADRHQLAEVGRPFPGGLAGMRLGDGATMQVYMQRARPATCPPTGVGDDTGENTPNGLGSSDQTVRRPHSAANGQTPISLPLLSTNSAQEEHGSTTRTMGPMASSMVSDFGSESHSAIEDVHEHLVGQVDLTRQWQLTASLPHDERFESGIMSQETSLAIELAQSRRWHVTRWRPLRWLAARREALRRGQVEELWALVLNARRFTDEAIANFEYWIEKGSAPRPNKHVNLEGILTQYPSAEWVGRQSGPPVRQNDGSNDDAPQMNFDVRSPLDIAASLRRPTALGSVFPIILVAEVTRFDDLGRIDVTNANSITPRDLLLRTDIVRYLKATQTVLDESGPQQSPKNHMTAAGDPYMLRCPNVTIFRGPQEEGFPFLDEPVQVHVILTALANNSPKISTLESREHGTIEWYADQFDHACLLERLSLVGSLAQQPVPGAESRTNKPVLLMTAPGCENRARQPHEGLANSLKHWRRKYSAAFASSFVCCTSRGCPDPTMAAGLDAIVNQRSDMQGLLDQHAQQQPVEYADVEEALKSAEDRRRWQEDKDASLVACVQLRRVDLYGEEAEDSVADDDKWNASAVSAASSANVSPTPTPKMGGEFVESLELGALMHAGKATKDMIYDTEDSEPRRQSITEDTLLVKRHVKDHQPHTTGVDLITGTTLVASTAQPQGVLEPHFLKQTRHAVHNAAALSTSDAGKADFVVDAHSMVMAPSTCKTARDITGRKTKDPGLNVRTITGAKDPGMRDAKQLPKEFIAMSMRTIREGLAAKKSRSPGRSRANGSKTQKPKPISDDSIDRGEMPAAIRRHWSAPPERDHGQDSRNSAVSAPPHLGRRRFSLRAIISGGRESIVNVKNISSAFECYEARRAEQLRVNRPVDIMLDRDAAQYIPTARDRSIAIGKKDMDTNTAEVQRLETVGGRGKRRVTDTQLKLRAEFRERLRQTSGDSQDSQNGPELRRTVPSVSGDFMSLLPPPREEDKEAQKVAEDEADMLQRRLSREVGIDGRRRGSHVAAQRQSALKQGIKAPSTKRASTVSVDPNY